MLYDFVCLRCGGRNLDYHKWVHSREPLKIHSDGHVEYGLPQVDHETVLGLASCYVCRDCGTAPSIYGKDLYCEADLREYLSRTLEERQKMEQDYIDELARDAEMEDIQGYCDEDYSAEQKRAQDDKVEK